MRDLKELRRLANRRDNGNAVKTAFNETLDEFERLRVHHDDTMSMLHPDCTEGCKYQRLQAALRRALRILEAMAAGQQCSMAASDLAPKIERMLNGVTSRRGTSRDPASSHTKR